MFLYIGIGIAMLFSVVSGIRTAHAIINHLVTSDTVGWYQLYNSTEMTVNAAFLLISFIVLVAILRKTRGAINEYQGTIWYTLCRTIIFIILTASVAMTAVAISILFGDILSGDLSANNFLKALFVAGVGLGIFYYFRGVLRGAWRTEKKQEQVFVVITSIVVGAMVLGAIVIFNPVKQPALRRSYDKLDCIRSVSSTLKDMYSNKERRKDLPATEAYTEFLENNLRPYHHMREQECVDANISYELIDKTHYRLCASFEVLPEGTTVKHYPYRKFEVKELGKNCFEFDVEE